LSPHVLEYWIQDLIFFFYILKIEGQPIVCFIVFNRLATKAFESSHCPPIHFTEKAMAQVVHTPLQAAMKWIFHADQIQNFTEWQGRFVAGINVRRNSS
jgi:hypothetical protein